MTCFIFDLATNTWLSISAEHSDILMDCGSKRGRKRPTTRYICKNAKDVAKVVKLHNVKLPEYMVEILERQKNALPFSSGVNYSGRSFITRKRKGK